jgi:hypothetical protein
VNRAVGVYAFIAENEVDDPTLTVIGEGPLDEGPMPNSTLGNKQLAAEEGILGMQIPRLGFTNFIFLDTRSSHTKRMMELYKPRATRAARLVNKRIELVYFGANGREHIEWIE